MVDDGPAAPLPDDADRRVDPLAAGCRALRAATAAGGVPGGVLLVGLGDRILCRAASGLADATPGARRPMTADTVFDLASLTKVVATLPLVLGLIADGRLAVDALLGSVVPGVGAAGVTVAQLLTHTAGLPPTLGTPAPTGSPAGQRPGELPPGDGMPGDGMPRDGMPGPGELREQLRRVTPVAPGTRVRYSDVGFLLLGLLCERVYSAPLDEAFAAVVAAPTGMERSGFRRPGSLPPAGVSYAATEAVGGAPARTGLVHDETAEVLGGVAGHAGLFADATDIGRYLTRWWVPRVTAAEGLPGAALRSAALRSDALRCWTPGYGAIPGSCGNPGCSAAPGSGSHRGLGWVLSGDPMDVARGWPSGTASHTGFTGTSVAFDPVSRLWCVLLTNAVHAGRGRPHIGALRSAVHTALAPLAAPPSRPCPAS